MQRIIVDAAALLAVVDEIEHELMMMGFSDEETAADDWSFSGPRIRNATDKLRNVIRKAEQFPEGLAPVVKDHNKVTNQIAQILKAGGYGHE